MDETGKILKKIRKEKKKNLKYISQITNIKETTLKKIEEEKYLQELGYFYGKSHIKSYLEALEVDKEKINEIIKNEFPPSQKEEIIEENVLGTFNKLKFFRFKKNRMFIYLPIIIIISVFILIFAIKNIDFKLSSIFAKSLTLPQKKVDLSINLPERKIINLPVAVKLIVNEKVWLKVSDNLYTKEKYGKYFKKSDKEHIFKGYDFDLIINDPSCCQLFLNGKELKYLQKIKKPQKLTFNPQSIKKIFEKEEKYVTNSI